MIKTQHACHLCEANYAFFLNFLLLSMCDGFLFSLLLFMCFCFLFLSVNTFSSSLLSLFAVVYIYIFLTCSFPLDYFSPSLPLQAAVAATANTSTVTTATVGTPGAPGAHPQRAPGSHSPGPASHNIPSVNEGTD